MALVGVGLKTWEWVDSDRKLVESQQQHKLYLNQSKADGGWIEETTGSGVLLTGCMREKDTASKETTPDFGVDGGDATLKWIGRHTLLPVKPGRVPCWDLLWH